MEPSNLSSAFTFDSASQDPNTSFHTPSQTETYMPAIETERVRVIWGTTINIQETSDIFKEYISAHHQSAIDSLIDTQTRTFYLNGALLPRNLENTLSAYPGEVVPILQHSLAEIIYEKDPSTYNTIKNVIVRPYNIGSEISIRNLDTSCIERIISMRGIVIRTSPIVPELLKAIYICIKCKGREEVEQIQQTITTPTECRKCNARYCFEMSSEESLYCDKQIIKIQEVPHQVPSGSTPLTVTVVASDDLCDKIVPGDRVSVCGGVLRVKGVRDRVIGNGIKSMYRIYIEMYSYEKINENIEARPREENNGQPDYEKTNENKESIAGSEKNIHSKNQFSYKDSSKTQQSSNFNEYSHLIDSSIFSFKNIQFIDKLRKMELHNLYKILINSVAPQIYGHETVKKSILLQLIGGVRKLRNKSRGDINILLVGDPGIAKSQILTYVHKLSNRGMYTSGRGSSAVGLTASVARDPETGQFVLEPGALVLSDNGICCIDEFDKMSDSTKAVLHEVMEQQTISISKAGIFTTLNARCSILASCNPVRSKYDKKKSIIENINISCTLLSRFGVVGILIDKSDEENDRRIGNHIVSFFNQEEKIMNIESNASKKDEDRPLQPLTENPIDLITSSCLSEELNYFLEPELFKEYINECKKIHPHLTDESKEILTKSYLDLRLLDKGKTITATTRQLESLIRLSEAHARMRMSLSVDVIDVEEAVRIIKESMLVYAVDPRTGKVDMEMVCTGKCSHRRRIIEEICERIKNMVKNIKTKKSISDVIIELKEHEEKMVKQAIKNLADEDYILVDDKNISRLAK